MKNIISLLITGCIITLAACSQRIDDSKVPSPVKSSFAKDFPGVSSKWEKEKLNYEANFGQDGKTMSALYDGNGNRQETETDIKVSDLPTPVQDYITNNYPGKKIKEAAVITKANGEVNYEAEVNDMDVLFAQDGKFIKTAKD
ncbi:MAG: PepSY-like domain-containing protein [Bacteroidota bacterium]|nr:PepSY-like domain-containing protein [Bacteroidota bacterium]